MPTPRSGRRSDSGRRRARTPGEDKRDTMLRYVRRRRLEISGGALGEGNGKAMNPRPRSDDLPAEPVLSGLDASAAPSAALLLALACGTVGAVRVPRFLEPRLCQETIDSFPTYLYGQYDPDYYHSVAYRFGPTLNEYRGAEGLRSVYWEQARRARSVAEAHNALTVVRAATFDRLQHAWPGGVRPATATGRELFWGIVREINDGALVHWDDVTREHSPDLLDVSPVTQLALNVFLSFPNQGGETLVWRRQWSQADEVHRTGFGYSRVLVEGDPCTAVRARVGDAVIFNSRNYHAVEPSGGGRRVAFASFLGIDSIDDLLLWS